MLFYSLFCVLRCSFLLLSSFQLPYCLTLLVRPCYFSVFQLCLSVYFLINFHVFFNVKIFPIHIPSLQITVSSEILWKWCIRQIHQKNVSAFLDTILCVSLSQRTFFTVSLLLQRLTNLRIKKYFYYHNFTIS